MVAGVLPVIETPEPEPESPSIVDFLTGHYDVLEAGLRCICLEHGGACGGGGVWCDDGCPTCCGGDKESVREDTLMALDLLAAQRAILAIHTPDRTASDPWTRTVDPECSEQHAYGHVVVYENECRTLQILAWPFRDHPGYDEEEWAPLLPAELTGNYDEYLDEVTP
jgi:hypothetical protein